MRHIIHTDSVYDIPGAAKATGYSPTAIKREIRRGRLVATKRINAYRILGCDLWAWLQAGRIVCSKLRPVPAGTPSRHAAPVGAEGDDE